MPTVMLIDGNSLTYRAFFALPTDMATASGQVTNAVFGFTSMLINLMKDHEPDHVAVAFDRPEPTFRHEMTPTYKAQRESAPDILRQQMGLVREVLEAMAMGLPVVGTTSATQGVAAEDGRDYIVANTAEEQASAIRDLLREPQRARELGAAARRYVDEHYDWERVFDPLEDILKDAVQQRGTNR